MQALKERFSSLIPFMLTFIYLGLLVVGMASKDHGILVSWQLKKECDNIGLQIESLEQENKGLRREWDRLTGDLRYIEKIARQELSMIGEREVVFFFPE